LKKIKSIQKIMDKYKRAYREEPYMGIIFESRGEPSIEVIREELAESISKVLGSIFNDKYGPLLGVVSQPAVNEFLKGFESNLSRTKGDLTIVLEELLDRVVPKNLRKKS